MGRYGAEGRCGADALSLSPQHDGKPYCNHPCYAALFGPKGRAAVAGVVAGRSKGLRVPSLSEVQPSVQPLVQPSVHLPSHSDADPTPSLFQGLAGEELRATRSSKLQVGACPRSSPPASGSSGWLGLSPARQAGKAGMPPRPSGLAVSPALMSVLGLNLLGSSSSLPPAPGTISTHFALAVDTKGFCFGTRWQRQGLSWSTVVSGVSLLPSPPCLHPPLSSIPLQV